MHNKINTFFTKDVYDTEIRLDVNEDVLERIYNDNISPNDELPIEFVFITDTEEKAKRLKQSLSLEFAIYNDLEVEETEDYWEVHGITNAIEMKIIKINEWNQVMWDFGYRYDCQLDGWQVGY
ncbi:ribonuclease E inhibitor RraB [Pedobacter steynii]